MKKLLTLLVCVAAITMCFAVVGCKEGGDMAPTTPENVLHAPDAPKVPAGFKAAAGTAAEPYTNTGWAQEIVHQATGIDLVFIPAGSFQMGSPKSEQESVTQETKDLPFPVNPSDEGPQREVRITRPFYMARYEVTQREWQAVMGANPSEFKNDDRLPVERVTWDDCQEFLRKTGGGLRLPTEAEWEYACRAGTKTTFHTGVAISTDEANYKGDLTYCNGRKGQYRETTVAVGALKANAWGLYDMHGNVGEWCQDWYGEEYYGRGENVDPSGPASGSDRVTRGGCYAIKPQDCRSASRRPVPPTSRGGCLGLRVVVEVGPGH